MILISFYNTKNYLFINSVNKIMHIYTENIVKY